MATIACLPLISCGTYIPSQRDWPNSSTSDVIRMNATLAHSVVCELSYAVTLAIRNDLDLASRSPGGKAYSEFLQDWGVEVATDLTVSENSTIAPGFIWTPDKPISIGGGVSVGSVSTNETQYNVFFPLSALYKPNLFRLDDKTRPCRNPDSNNEGSPLIDIDLKILPTLESRLITVRLGIAGAPTPENTIVGEKNVLSQTVSIKESISGDVTPKWVFTTKSVNPDGTFFKAGRDRTHQLVFTFGPMTPGTRSLNPLAEAFHLTQLERAGLRNDR